MKQDIIGQDKLISQTYFHYRDKVYALPNSQVERGKHILKGYCKWQLEDFKRGLVKEGRRIDKLIESGCIEYKHLIKFLIAQLSYQEVICEKYSSSHYKERRRF